MDRDGEYEGAREQSRSPAPRRSASPARRDEDERMPDRDRREPRSEATENPGTNLFVTGIAPRIDETELRELFSKYGEVDSVQIMTDPHTRDSRGFGFVSMMTGEQAEAAREGLSGEEKYGRVISVEKARRARPRTPTPGKYFGPPKRDDAPRRGPPRRYDDRGYGGGYGRDDRYHSRDDRRGYGGDRYGSSRYDDRGSSRYDDRPRYEERPRYHDRPPRDDRDRDYDRPPRDDRSRY